MKKNFTIKSSKSLPKAAKKSFKVFASKKYQVGDVVEYDSNFRGVNPNLGQGTIVQVKPGLAGHGDTNPDPIYVIETETGRVNLDGPAIIRKIEGCRSMVRGASDLESADRYYKMISKQVPDTDGFLTDYTMYFDKETGMYICILGDNELYTPDNCDPDFETDNGDEAAEWYNCYGEDAEDCSDYLNNEVVSSTNVKASFVLADTLEEIADSIYDMYEIGSFTWNNDHSICNFTLQSDPTISFNLFQSNDEYVWHPNQLGYSIIHSSDYDYIEDFLDSISWELETPADISASTSIKSASLFRKADAGQIIIKSDGSCTFNVFDNGKQLASENLTYGDTPYDNCSWRTSFTSPDFPFVGEKLKQIADKYGLTQQDIEFKLSGKKYYGAPLDEKDLDNFIGQYVVGYIPENTVEGSTSVKAARGVKEKVMPWNEFSKYKYKFNADPKGLPNPTFDDDVLRVANQNNCIRVVLMNGAPIGYLCQSTSDYDNFVETIENGKILKDYIRIGPVNEFDDTSIIDKLLEKWNSDVDKFGADGKIPKWRQKDMLKNRPRIYIDDYTQGNIAVYLPDDMYSFDAVNSSTRINASDQGFVKTYCDECGALNRVQVFFPDAVSPFEDTTFICSECGTENTLTDPHVYDEDGNMIDDGISQQDALNFLNSLPEDRLGEIYYQYNTRNNDELAYIITDEDLVKLGYDSTCASTKIMAYDEVGLDDLWDEIQNISQEFTSENTSINGNKLPAIFNMVNFEPGTINVDYGGGKFDNVAEYLAKADVINLVFDPFNRSAEHNKEVIDLIRKAGGADTATCSNVLNVIKEPEVRKSVLNNIRRLTKDGGKVYITVYEGRGDSAEGPTKSGYQLNRKTADYLEEIQQVFPDATRKGKLIVATNDGSTVAACDTYGCEDDVFGSNLMGAFDISDLLNVADNTLDPDAGSVSKIIRPNNQIRSEHFLINAFDVGIYAVVLESSGDVVIYDMDTGSTLATISSLREFSRYIKSINSGYRQMIDENEGLYALGASTNINADITIEPKLDPPDFSEPSELAEVEETIEIPFDCNITILEDGDWIYDDTSYDWAKGPGSNGNWYSEEGAFIGDKDSIVECIDDMLMTRLPDTEGHYHIEGVANLVFRVAGINEFNQLQGFDEDGNPDFDRTVDTEYADTKFDIQKSDILNFKYELK